MLSAQIEYTTYKYDGICIIIYNHNVYNTLIVQKSLYLKTLVQGQSSMYVHPVPVHVAFLLKESNLNVDSILISIYKHRQNCDSYWLSPHGTGNPSLLYVSHVFPVSINQYVAFAFILRKTIEIYQIKQKSIMLDNFILFSGSFLSSFYQKI